MSAGGWAVAASAAWILTAFAVALLVGRIIRWGNDKDR